MFYFLPSQRFILSYRTLRQKEFKLHGVLCKADTLEGTARAGIASLAARRRELIVGQGFVDVVGECVDLIFYFNPELN